MKNSNKVILFIVFAIFIVIFFLNINNSNTDGDNGNLKKKSIPKDEQVTSDGVFSLGRLELNEKFSADVSLDIFDYQIESITFIPIYKNEEYLPNKNINSQNKCKDSPESEECFIEEKSISLNNIGLYIICENKFPNNKWYLNDEEYNIVKQAYDDLIESNNMNEYKLSRKCTDYDSIQY